MGGVQLKIPPWMAVMLNPRHLDWLIIEKDIVDETTIGDLLEYLASKYSDFRKVVYNPDMGGVSEQVLVILNDSLLQHPDVTEVKVKDGDCVMLLPVDAGG